MRRTFGLTMLCVLLAAQCLAFAGQNSPSNGPWTISGVLVSATTGAPLDRAEVTLYVSGESGTQIAVTTTGETGAFRFQGLPAGKYALQGARRGYLTGGYMEHEEYATAIVTGPGLRSDGLRFELQPNAVISGVVTDESGDPARAVGARLWRVAHETGQNEYVQDQSVTTDDTGAYEFANLRPGTYFVEITGMPWYARSPQPKFDRNGNAVADDDPPSSPLDVAYPITFYANATDSDSATPIMLRAGEHVEANVTLHAVPAMHLRIQLPTISAEPGPHVLYSPEIDQESFGITEFAGFGQSYMTSDGHGGMVETVNGLPPGHYTIRMNGPEGVEGAGSSISLSSDQLLDLSSLAAASVAVSGKLVMASGAKLPDRTSITLRPEKGQTPGWGNPVQPDGSFSLHRVAAGSYKVEVRSPGAVLSIAQSAASGGDVHGDTLVVKGEPVLLAATVVSGSAAITGFAQKGGKGFAGAMVVLVPQDGADNPDLYRRDQTDSDGSFSLRRVVPGNYTLVAIENGWTLDWGRPEAMAPYLARGLKLQITEQQRSVELPHPLVVQSR